MPLQAPGGRPITPSVTRVRLIALFCAVVFLSTMAAPARSAPRAVNHDFATLAPASFTPTAHPLGRSVLSPANPGVAVDRLALGLPAGTRLFPQRRDRRVRALLPML